CPAEGRQLLRTPGICPRQLQTTFGEWLLLKFQLGPGLLSLGTPYGAIDRILESTEHPPPISHDPGELPFNGCQRRAAEGVPRHHSGQSSRGCPEPGPLDAESHETYLSERVRHLLPIESGTTEASRHH